MADAGRPPKSLAQLLDVDDPAWPLVEGWIETAVRPVEVLPPAATRGRALLETQATLRSVTGAVVHETGGLRIDHGWLRVLGSGHPRLPRTLPGWNETIHGPRPRGGEHPFTLIADDAVGGFYAVNHGGLAPAAALGHVFFFAPDRMRWEDMGAGYTDWLQWALHGDVAGYYRDLRWPGWEQQAFDLPGDQALALYPLPFSKEGRDVAAAQKRPVPVAELYDLYVRDFAPQLAGLKTGDPFALEVQPADDDPPPPPPST